MDLIKILLILVAGVLLSLYFFFKPRQVFLFYILVKPIIDRMAEHGGTIFGIGIGVHYLGAIIIPSMAFLWIILVRPRFVSLPSKILVFLFILSNLISFGIIGQISVSQAGWYIRVVFPILLYFSIPFILEEREHILKFIKYSALSGIFPCMMIFLEKLGYVQSTRTEERLGSMVYDRATGGYADSFTAAMPIIVSLLCVLFMLQYRSEIKNKALHYWIVLSAFLFSLFFTFHRMTYIVVSITISLWTLVNRKIKLALLIIILTAITLPILIQFVPDFFGVDAMIETKSGYMTDDVGVDISDRALHGRARVWRYFFILFNESPFLRQVFGVQQVGRAPHNDYIRILLTNGFFGFTVYLFLLILIGLKTIRIYRYYSIKNDTFMRQVSLTSFFMYIFYTLGSMTLAISLLSTMSWYFWIFYGIIVHQFYRDSRTS